MPNDSLSNANHIKVFADFLATDKNAVLIAKSDGHTTALYTSDDIETIEDYYIRAKDVFIKGKNMDVKFEKESESIIISFEGDESEEPDYLYDIIGVDDAFEENEDNKEMPILN